jgi:NAD(P)-dependent dehydrogenase (short-subunit alcohol dehydrogenase family)
MDKMQGKTVVITGATSGIGLECAQQLSAMGARIIVLGRDQKKAEKALEKLENGKRHQSVIADLSAQEEVREVASQIRSQVPEIDTLINNAAGVFSKWQLSRDGIEKTFATNHLGHFLLTHLLWPSLEQSSSPRIINVSSHGHYKGKIYFDNLNLKDNYFILRAYAQSKLANVLFTYELDRRKPHDDLTTNCVHPGLVDTAIGTKGTSWLAKLAWNYRRRSGVPPEKGARTIVHLAADKAGAAHTGLYWYDMQPMTSSVASYNREDAKRLWEVSKRLCGIDDFFC